MSQTKRKLALIDGN